MIWDSIHWLISFFAVVLFFVILLIILIPSEKKLKKKFEIKKEIRRNLYVNHISVIRGLKKHPEQALEKINNLAKKFFFERLGIPKNLEYLEISELVKKEKSEDVSTFCNKMEEYLYSKKEITFLEIEELLNELEQIVIRGSQEEQKEKILIETIQNKDFLNNEIRDYEKLKSLPVLKDVVLTNPKSNIFKSFLTKPKKILIEGVPTQGPDSLFLGKIKETNQNSYLKFDDLLGNVLITGSKGSGKTICAQGLAEGTLLKKKSVIVFDLTSKWSGFFRKGENKEMVKKYLNFGMDPKNLVSFKTLIKRIKDPYEILDFKDYVENEGEITILDMSHLTPVESDLFITCAIEQLYRMDLEFTRKFKTLLIFEEVHHLLLNQGGSGYGLIQLERIIRDFPNRGIGLILTSKLLKGFIEPLKGDIETKIHMNTNKEEDLNLIKKIYSEKFLEPFKNLSSGEAMIINENYNESKPYFISIKPVMHNLSGLNTNELDLYDNYLSLIEDLEYQIFEIKRLNGEVSNLEFDLKVTKQKFKSGQFEIAKSYLESIIPKVNDCWKLIKRRPTHLLKRRIKKETIMEGIMLAKKERSEWHKKVNFGKLKPKEEPKKVNPLKKGLKYQKNTSIDLFSDEQIDEQIFKIKSRIKELSRRDH